MTNKLLFGIYKLITMNISGILVQTKPENVQDVLSDIKAEKDWEYHLHDEKGRIILTIEGINAEEELKKLNKLKLIRNIITADMVYSYSEDELDELRDNIDNSAQVPAWLNDPNVKAEQIKYNGDLKKKY